MKLILITDNRILEKPNKNVAYDPKQNGDSQKHVIGFVVVALRVDFFWLSWIVLDFDGLAHLVHVGDIRFCEFAGVFIPVYRVRNDRDIFGSHEGDKALFDVFDYGVGCRGATPFLGCAGDDVFNYDDQEDERNEPENDSSQNHIGSHLSFRFEFMSPTDQDRKKRNLDVHAL